MEFVVLAKRNFEKEIMNTETNKATVIKFFYLYGAI